MGKLALVLGAGGVVGIAHHVGVLRALHDELGFDPNDVTTIIGTSAGAVVAAYVRAGYDIDALWELVALLARRGAQPAVDASAPQAGGVDAARAVRELMTLAGRGVNIAKRGVGMSVMLAHSTLGIPLPWMTQPLGRVLSPSLFDFEEDAAALSNALGTTWPRKTTWLATVDSRSSERIVCGAKASVVFAGNTIGLRTIAFSQAVVASCAVPGVWPPQPVGNRLLVDGGVRSATNVDLARQSGATAVLVSAPLAFRGIDWQQLRMTNAALHAARMLPHTMLERELSEAREAGLVAHCVSPDTRDLQIYGQSALRGHSLLEVAERARVSTAEHLKKFPEIEEMLFSFSSRRDVK